MENREHYLKSFLIAGLLMGALSSIPGFNLGNCCCLWQWLGGLLSGWILCRSAKKPVQMGEGALVGLFSGLIGGMLFSLMSAMSFYMGAGDWNATMTEAFHSSGSEIPPEIQEVIEQAMQWISHPGLLLSIGMFFFLLVFAIMSMIGSLISVAIFEPRFALKRMRQEMKLKVNAPEQFPVPGLMNRESDLIFPRKKEE